MTSVVTPWRTFGSWRGSASIISPPWLCRSMKPGATTWPVASMRRAARRCAVSPLMMRSRSPITPTAAANPGPPPPSTTVPPSMSRSNASVTRGR